jgi:hypothetical protein
VGGRAGEQGAIPLRAWVGEVEQVEGGSSDADPSPHLHLLSHGPAGLLGCWAAGSWAAGSCWLHAPRHQNNLHAGDTAAPAHTRPGPGSAGQRRQAGKQARHDTTRHDATATALRMRRHLPTTRPWVLTVDRGPWTVDLGPWTQRLTLTGWGALVGGAWPGGGWHR